MFNDDIGQQMSFKLVTNRKIFIFYVYFLNTDISVIMALVFLKISIHITKVSLEGSVSQNVDIGLSFCFMLCKRWNFEEKDGKKYQRFPVFAHKIKTRA